MLRHLYRILLKESILRLYVGSAFFMRLSIYPSLRVIGKPAWPATLSDGEDDSGVEDSQNSSISKKSWVISEPHLYFFIFNWSILYKLGAIILSFLWHFIILKICNMSIFLFHQHEAKEFSLCPIIKFLFKGQLDFITCSNSDVLKYVTILSL